MPRLLPPAALLAVTGFAVMALEVLLPRLLAPRVGTSAEVWAATFAVVLSATALGNKWGGRLAQGGRRGALRWFFAKEAVLLWLAAAMARLATQALRGGGPLDALAAWPPLPRAVASLALAAGPAFLVLGAVTTLATNRAIEGSDRPGRAIALLGAAGAAGSIAGTYASGFLLVPAWSTTAGLGLLAALLVIASLPWTFDAVRHRPVVVAVPPRAAPRPIPRHRAARLAVLLGAGLFLVEIVAGRTASRLAGDSVYTWTAVLGAVLLGWTVGEAVSSRGADGKDPTRRLGVALLVASVLTALTAWTPAVVPPLVEEPGPTLPWRIALGAVLAWAPAAAAFGFAAPLLVRATLVGGPRDPRTVGTLFAASALGGGIACLVANPVLIPAIGTNGVLLACALVLALATPLAGRRVERPWAAGVGVALLAATLPFAPVRAVGARLALRDDHDAVFSADSRYGRVRVDVPPEARALGRPNLRRLVIDGFVHGYADLDDPAWLGYGYEGVYAAATDRIAPAGGPAPRALFLGGGGCAFPRWLARERPGAAIDVVEIDPVVTRAAREAMGLPDPPPFAVTHEDARTFVERRPLDAPPYDLVYADAFDDLSVPWHLTTTEFVESLARRMTPRGAVLWNLVDAAWSGRFLGAVVTTLRRSFGYVVVLGPQHPGDAQETFVVVASREPFDLDGLTRPAGRTREGGAEPIRRWTGEEAEAFVRAADGIVLRDDKAPVESLLAPVVRRRERR